MRRIVKLGIGAAAVAVTLVVLVVVSAVSVPDDHSAYREGPSDLVAFREELTVAGYATGAVAGSPLALVDSVDPTRTLVVIAGVERPFRDAEVAALEEFVRSGGRLIVADDTGNGDQLTVRFGIHVAGVPVYDDNFRTNVSLVNVSARLPRSGAEPKSYAPLVMNVPSSLNATTQDARNVTVIASTSASSFGDLVGNRVRDTGDLKGPFVVGYDVKVGRGHVVVLSDPDLFASGLIADRALANRAFASDLVDRLLPEGGTVLFDESRHGTGVVEALPARALASVVTATRDPVVRWVSLAVAVAAGAGLLALVRGEERLGHHEGRLDRPAPVRLDDPATRVQRAARATVRLVHGARADDDVARLATDPVLAKVVASENPISTDKDLRDIVQRVRSYGANRQTGRGPP